MNTTIELEEIINKFQSYGLDFMYKMLDRLRQDCLYYLENGGRCKKYLWAKDEHNQITLMKMIYENLPEKPEWLSMEEIEKYEKEMI